MKKYECISDEDLVEKILRAQLLKDMGFRLHRLEVQEDFNKFWGIDIKKIISKFNEIQKLIEHLAYMNEELVCDNCGRHFTRWERNASNKSGRHFCSDLCSKLFSASCGNTKEKRLQKSKTIKQGILEGRIKLPLRLQNETLARKKEEYESNPKQCPICGTQIPYERKHLKTCSTKCGRKLNGINNHKTQMFRHSTGGKRHGSGRGKKGWYKGYWCDSSWELAWIIYQKEHGVGFDRFSGHFKYEFNGKTHNYYPDFILDDGTIVEIKGYSSKQWEAKRNSIPNDVKFQILYKADMKPILKYVVNKYGKDFIRLYEHGSVVQK